MLGTLLTLVLLRVGVFWANAHPTRSELHPLPPLPWGRESTASHLANPAQNPLSLLQQPIGKINTSQPCYHVSTLAASSSTTGIEVPIELAYACLQSIPLHISDAIFWLKSILPFVEWESDLAYLKDPPFGFNFPPVDLRNELQTVIADLEHGRSQFKTEYDLAVHISRLFQQCHNEHLVYKPKILALITFLRDMRLVSISADGQEMPKIYVWEDLIMAQADVTKISAVTRINDAESSTFLQDRSLEGSAQDLDALYNGLFVNVAAGTLGPGFEQAPGINTFHFCPYYPGVLTTLEFENGTTKAFVNKASIAKNFPEFTSIQNLYDTWINPSPFAIASRSANETGPSKTDEKPFEPVPAPYYPVPVLRDSLNLVGGYYIPEPRYTNVAVLSVTSFIPTDLVAHMLDNAVVRRTENGTPERIAAQDVSTTFIDRAVEDRKSRLILDLSGNGGGMVDLGFFIFSILFPDLSPVIERRSRAHHDLNVLGSAVSDLARDRRIHSQNATHSPVNDTLFDYTGDLDQFEKPFESWAAKFGPHALHNDNFTSVLRWTLSNTLGLNRSQSHNSTLYSPRRPFANDSDIVVVTDGYCASTCAILVELLRQQTQVRFVSLGGRPEPGLTSAVGGVRAGPMNNFEDLYSEIMYREGELHKASKLNNGSGVAEKVADVARKYSFTPVTRASQAVINMGNIYRVGDATQTPLQYSSELADCRILYTKDMVLDATEMWKAVADSAWYGPSRCMANNDKFAAFGEPVK
ncbi:MAG: hypothetical protein M1828_000025 [Chrysothrix sp. TS-e1954]|nr:MAG: hypothetical protein M1828_000025 [Chrysothrix sp. TS-e1954]